MRIGIVCYPTYGGSGAVATELGIALADRGHDVHFVSYERPFRLPGFHPRIQFHEVGMGEYPLFKYPPYDLALAVRLQEVMVQQRLDVLHVHYAIPHATSAWLANQLLAEHGRRVPVVTTLHGTDITIVGQDPSYADIVRFSIQRSDKVTAVSQWLHDETVKAFGCQGTKLEVIPNFVDPVRFDRVHHDPALHRSLGGGAKVMMHISNFRPVKRVRDVVKVFAQVRRGCDAVLVMVGDGPDRPQAEEEARALGVEQHVRFLGRIDAVAPLLAAADAFVFTSNSEAFGLAALEALASGVPVFAYRAGGITDVVRDGVTGALRDIGDVDGLARAACQLLGRPDAWQAASQAAAADARARFALAAVVPRYEQLYADARG